jgi:HK97 family phage prohead protease
MTKPKPPETKREQRYSHLRMQDAADGKPAMFVGYAVVYNSLSVDLCGFREIIKPGCFTEALKTADVRALIDHNPSLLLGRNKSGSLRLFDETKGLRVEIDVNATSYAQDLVITIGDGSKDGMSFGFEAEEDEWETDKEGCMIRSVCRAGIFDVSAVTYPAYIDSSIALRSLDHWKEHQASPNELDLMFLSLRERSFRPSLIP